MINFDKLKNFSKEKSELIALCIDGYTGDIVNYVTADVKTDPKSIEKQIRERIVKDVLHGEPLNARTFRKYKNDIFDIIEITIDSILPEGWNNNPFFNEFVEVRRLDLGDKNEFYIQNGGYLTVSKFSGNHWDTNRERLPEGAPYSIDTSWYVVHFYDEFERFMKNISSWADLMNTAIKSFTQAFNNATYTAFSGMSAFVPSAFTGNGTLSTDNERDNLLALLDKIYAANGNKPVIIGAASALRKLQGRMADAWIADSAKEERKEFGIVSAWEGFKLSEIPQVMAPGTFNFEISTNTLLLASSGTKPIKFVYEGESRINEVQDNRVNRDQTLEAQIQTKAGIGVIADQVIGKWTLA